MSREKSYHPGITGPLVPGPGDPDWGSTYGRERSPILDYPEHHNRHAVEAELELPPLPDWRYEPPVPVIAPRTGAFVVWCIKHRVAVALTLWGLIIAAGAALWIAW